MGQELRDTLQIVAQNNLNIDLFKEKVQKKFKLMQLADLEEYIRIFGDIEEKNATAILLHIIKMEQSKDFTGADAEKIPKVLTLLLSRYADDGNKREKREKKWRRHAIKLLDELEDLQHEELFLRRYIARQNAAYISKSDEHIEISSESLKQEILSSVSKGIEYAANTCCRQVDISIAENKNVDTSLYKCRWPQMAFYHYDIYPILPALLTCSAIYEQWCKSSPAKGTLLTPCTDLPEWEMPIQNTRTIVNERVHLCSQIENALEISLLPIAAPFVILTPRKQLPPVLNKEHIDEYEERIKNCDTRISYRSKKFGMLRCRSSKLSKELIRKFDMPCRTAQILRRDIDLYLHGLKKLNSAEAKEAFCDEIRAILKMCNKILSPATYYSVDKSESKQWHNIVFGAATGLSADLQKNILKFFDLEGLFSDREALKLRCAQKFYKKYFYEQKLSFNIVEQTVPMPMIGKLSTEYYNSLLKFYRTQVEKQYWCTEALAQWMGSKNTEPMIGELPRYIRTEVLKSFTMNDAFLIVEKTVNETKIKRCDVENDAKEYCSKKNIRTSINIYTRFVPDAWLVIYQFLLKTAFDAVGHYAIALLRKYTMRQCKLIISEDEINKTKARRQHASHQAKK